MTKRLEKIKEFRTLFIMGIGMALTREKYKMPTGSAIFNPKEKELKEREKYIENSYKKAEKEKIDLTLEKVYPFAKKYFISFRDEYEK